MISFLSLVLWIGEFLSDLNGEVVMLNALSRVVLFIMYFDTMAGPIYYPGYLLLVSMCSYGSLLIDGFGLLLPGNSLDPFPSTLRSKLTLLLTFVLENERHSSIGELFFVLDFGPLRKFFFLNYGVPSSGEAITILELLFHRYYC